MTPPSTDLRRAWAIVLASALVRFVFAARVPVVPDEAYYWEWSRQLDWGFFDHPPAIAALVRLGDLLLDPLGLAATPLAIRFGAVLAGAVAGGALVAAAKALAGERAALWTAAIFACTPGAQAALILATPDAPLLAACAVGVYALVHALQHEPGARASTRWWAAAGLALGAALASKYTALLMAVAVALALLSSDRRRLREPGPYVACLVAAIVVTPTLIWNAHHDWISFTFQWRHRLAAEPERSALSRVGELLLGQAALASPIVFWLMGRAAWRAFRQPDTTAPYTLSVMTLVWFGFFCLCALRQNVEANWPAAAYLPAIVLLSTDCGPARRSVSRLASLPVATALAAVMTVVLFAQTVAPVLPIPPRADPLTRAHGWDEVAAGVDATAREATRTTASDTWIGGNAYQDAAELALRTPAHPQVFSMNVASRGNQYDLWPRFYDRARLGDNLVLALDDVHAPAVVAALSPHFEAAAQTDRVVMRRGGVDFNARCVWRFMRWKGTRP